MFTNRTFLNDLNLPYIDKMEFFETFSDKKDSESSFFNTEKKTKKLEQEERYKIRESFINYFQHYQPSDWNVLFATYWERETSYFEDKRLNKTYFEVIANFLKREYLSEEEKGNEIILVGHHEYFNEEHLNNFFAEYIGDLEDNEILKIKERMIFFVSKEREYWDYLTRIKLKTEEITSEWRHFMLFFIWEAFFEIWKNKFFLKEGYKLFYKPKSIITMLGYWFNQMKYLCWNENCFFINIHNSNNLWSYINLFDNKNFELWKSKHIPIDFFAKYLCNFNCLAYWWENDGKFSSNYRVIKSNNKLLQNSNHYEFHYESHHE